MEVVDAPPTPNGTKKIRVKCTYYLDVEVPAEWIVDGYVYFDIEERNCPNTGCVGMALDKLKAEHEMNSTCWACAAQGKNEIVQLR